MLKFFRFLNKWEIHPLTPLWVILALLSGQGKPIFLNYLMAFIHELGHLSVAFFLRVKVDKIEWLPFGFFAQMNSLSNEHFIKEFLILIAGPLMFFANQGVLNFLYGNNLLSYYGFSLAQKFNWVLLWFNLIPLVPLDGSRLLNWFLSFFITERLALYVTGVVSAITLLILFVITEIGNSWLISIFLVTSIISYFRLLPHSYLTFLLSREQRKRKLPIRIHSQNDLFRHFVNCRLHNGMLLPEKLLIKHVLVSTIKKRFAK